jgi:hypothetical protein
MSTQNERLATVEARLDALVPTVNEIRGDVKTLLAAHNRQKGAAKLVALLWAGLLTLAGGLGAAFMGRVR